MFEIRFFVRRLVGYVVVHAELPACFRGLVIVFDIPRLCLPTECASPLRPNLTMARCLHAVSALVAFLIPICNVLFPPRFHQVAAASLTEGAPRSFFAQARF